MFNWNYIYNFGNKFIFAAYWAKLCTIFRYSNNFIMKQFGNIYSNIYGIVVAIAIFTSAISAGYGFLEKFEYSKVHIKKYL